MNAPLLHTFDDPRFRLETRCHGIAGGLSAELVQVEGKGDLGDPLCLRLRLRNTGKASWRGIIEVGLHRAASSPRFFLPGFLYGTNRGDRPLPTGLHRHFPRLRPGPVEPPHAPRWSARSDQLTHPLAALHTTEGFLALSTAPQTSPDEPAVGFWCVVEAGCAAIGCTFGHADDPGIYRSPFDFERPSEEWTNALYLGPAEVFAGEIFVYSFDAACTGLGGLLKDTYHWFHAPPRAGEPPERAVEAMANAIVDDAYEPERKTFALIWMDPVEEPPGEPARYALTPPEETTYRRFHEGGIAWTNGLVIAVPLLQAAERLRRPAWRETARAVIDDIVAHSLNPRTGLPYAAKINGVWSNRGWWARWIESEGAEPGHPAYLVGQALCYLAKACEWEERAKAGTPAAWEDFSARVLEALLPSQTPCGAFPRFWNEETGAGEDDESFAGCWVAAALAAHGVRQKESTWLAAAERAELHYHAAGVARMECAKTPLDVADAADAEGILGYIRLARLLDEQAPCPKRLQRLRHGLDYALSFVFCHNVRVPGPPLDAHPWSSAGGAITSVGNAVVHAMTNRVLDDMEYVRRRSNDPYIGERLRDIYRWGLQTFNRHDHDFFFGKRGWATEYFCQGGRYVLDIRLADGRRSNVWFAYHPWATASLIEGICGDLWEQRKTLATEHRTG